MAHTTITGLRQHFRSGCTIYSNCDIFLMIFGFNFFFFVRSFVLLWHHNLNCDVNGFIIASANIMGFKWPRINGFIHFCNDGYHWKCMNVEHTTNDRRPFSKFDFVQWEIPNQFMENVKEFLIRFIYSIHMNILCLSHIYFQKTKMCINWAQKFFIGVFKECSILKRNTET